MFSYLSPEQRVRPDHPLRAVRAMADLVLGFPKTAPWDLPRPPGRKTVDPPMWPTADLIWLVGFAGALAS